MARVSQSTAQVDNTAARAQHQCYQPANGQRSQNDPQVFAQPQSTPVYGPREPRPSKLDAFKTYIEERLKAGVWNARVLLRDLRKRGYTGGYTILTDWLRPQREWARAVAVRRFETPIGHQAQVDWGHLGTIEVDGKPRPMWGFTCTLGYSRAMMAEAAVLLRRLSAEEH